MKYLHHEEGVEKNRVPGETNRWRVMNWRHSQKDSQTAVEGVTAIHQAIVAPDKSSTRGLLKN
jgi:hypothetical protein